MTRYPLLDPESVRYQDLVTRHRQELVSSGVTTLPGLVTQEALDIAVKVHFFVKA